MLFWEVVLRFHLISKGVPDTNRLNAWWTNTLQCFGKWSFSFPLHTSKRVLTASLGSLFWGAALTLTTHPKNPISLDQESAKFSWKGPDSNYFELSGHTVTDLTTQLFCSVVAPWKKWVFQWNSSYQLLLKLKSQVLLLYWPSSSEHKPLCQCHSFSSSPIIHLSNHPSINLSFHSSVHPFTHLLIHSPICPWCIHPSVYMGESHLAHISLIYNY